MTSTEGSSEKKNKWKNETTGKKVLRNHFSSPGTFPAWQKRWKTVSLFSFCFESWAKVFPGHFFFLRCFLSSGNLIRFSHTLFECWFKRSSTEKSKKKKSLEVSTFALISIIRFFLLNEVAVMIFHRSFFLFPRIYPAVGWTDIFKWRVDGDIAGNEKNGRAFQA